MNDKPETIGHLYDRLPRNEWIRLPEYGIEIKAVKPVDLRKDGEDGALTYDPLAK